MLIGPISVKSLKSDRVSTACKEPPAFLVQKSALPLEKDKRETFEAELREMISRLDASLQRQFLGSR